MHPHAQAHTDLREIFVIVARHKFKRPSSHGIPTSDYTNLKSAQEGLRKSSSKTKCMLLSDVIRLARLLLVSLAHLVIRTNVADISDAG